MGYQESFIQFKSLDHMKEQLSKYDKRNKENDLAEIVCIDRVKKDVYPFFKGNLVAVVCGERSEQRNLISLHDGLGLNHVNAIVFIDNYLEQANGHLELFLNEHFERLSDAEYNQIIGKAEEHAE